MSGFSRESLVDHDRFQEVMEEVNRTWERALEGDKQVLPIIGPTRIGKSQAMKAFLCSETVIDGQAIYIMAPDNHTARALPDACLASVNMNSRVYKNGTEATKAFLHVIRRLGTRLIIFDEAQHMLERSGHRTIRGAADFLKVLLDQSDASIVLVGLPALEGLFRANEQLAARARVSVKFFPYLWSGDEYLSFRKALASAVEMLQEQDWTTPDAKDAEFAKRMYLATSGCYGLVDKIFVELSAAKRGGKHADYDAFAAAYENCIRTRVVGFNPFDRTQVIEPEHMALAYTQVMREAGVEKEHYTC